MIKFSKSSTLPRKKNGKCRLETPKPESSQPIGSTETQSPQSKEVVLEETSKETSMFAEPLATVSMPAPTLETSTIGSSQEPLSARVIRMLKICRVTSLFALIAAKSCVQKSLDCWTRFLHWHAPRVVTWHFSPTSLLKPFLPRRWHNFARELLPEDMRGVVKMPVAIKDSWQLLVDRLYLESVKPDYVLKQSLFGWTKKALSMRKLWAVKALQIPALERRVVPKISIGLCLGIAITAGIAYALWSPFISRPRIMGVEVEKEKVVVPKEALQLILPRIREYSLFTSRTPDTLLNLKNTVMTMIKDNKKLALTAAQEEALVLLAIREGMTPQPEEINVLKDLEADQNLLWSLANYTRSGYRSWWHRLTGRSLPK